MAVRSTKVVFHNETLHQLTKLEESLPWGIWSDNMAAPTSIEPQTTVAWQSESDGVLQGTEGRVRYQVGWGHPNAEVYLHWDNPYYGKNSYHQSTIADYEVFHEGGGGDNATVNFFLRESYLRFTPFTPSVHGFRFTNSWPDYPYADLVLPVIQTHLGNAHQGMCGGMINAALDYYYAGRIIPPNTSPPMDDDRPLFNYIANRLFDSFEATSVATYMQYMAPWYPDTDTGLGDGYSTVMVEQEFPAIRRQILNGSPVPIGLVMIKSYSPTDLGHNHQVLVRGYQQSGQKITLWLYDPNTPREPNPMTSWDKADEVTMEFDMSTLSEPIYVKHNVQAPGPIYCFFRLPYSSKRPLPGPFSLRTYELSHHHPLGTGLKGYRQDGNLVTNLRMLV